MKLYKLLPLILIFVYTNAYGAYTGTLPKDIGTSTPLGSENPNVIDDVLRERGTIQYNLYKLKFVGTDTTLLTNDTWVVGSSSTAMLITMPAASSCANTSVTKPFVITNYSSGTITLNVSVDGVGSPTIKGSQTMSLFTDGTRWYEIRAGNAYDSDYLGGVIASGYARSGSNSDITEITGLTTYLAVGQGGSGTNTAAGAASAFGVGTEDTPTLTGIVATGSSTLTTFALSNGTVSGNLGISGSVSGLEDADIPNTITLDNLTQVTTRNYNDVSGTSTISPTTATVTSARITSGTVSGTLEITGSVTGLEDADIPNTITLDNLTQVTTRNYADLSGTATISPTTATVSGTLGITGSVTGLEDADIPNTITLDNLTQVTTRNYADLSGTATISPTTATITTLNNTNFSGSAGTFTGNLQMASVTGFDYLKQWRVDSTIGTGSLNFAAGLGITFTPTYANGNGTITVTASGTSSAGGWTHTGTQTIGIAGSQVLPSGTLTIHADYGMTGVLDRDIPNTITLDNLTQVTTRQLADMQGLLSIATQTGGVGFSIVTGSATSNQLPIILNLYATTTTSIASETTGRFRLVRNNQIAAEETNAMLLHFDGTGSSTTFIDSSYGSRTVTATGGAVISTVYSVFGGASLRPAAATGSYASIADDEDFDFGTSSFTLGGRVFLNTIGTAADLIKKGEDTPNKAFTVEVDSTAIHLLLSTTGTGNQYDFPGTHTFALGTWTAWEICRNGSDIYFFINGNQLGAKQDIGTNTAIYNSNQAVWVGGCKSAGNWLMDGYLDEVYTIKGTALHTGTYTVSASPYVASDLDTPAAEYYSYSLQYIAPSMNYALMSSYTPGTYSSGASYIFNYATTTAFGYATSTSMSSAGSTSVYSTESLNSELAANFVVKSKDLKGRNFQKVTISALDKIGSITVTSWNPVNHKDMYRMDAETIAKEAFIRQNKDDWKSLHELEYVSEIIETGTGTINVINVVAMEKGYRDYIELEWASSTEQSDWTNTVEDNAESDLTMRNYGLRLDDPATPDELRKPAGIGLMDWNALNTKAIQELKTESDKQKLAWQAMLNAIERLGGTITVTP